MEPGLGLSFVETISVTVCFFVWAHQVHRDSARDVSSSRRKLRLSMEGSALRLAQGLRTFIFFFFPKLVSFFKAEKKVRVMEKKHK